MYNLQTVKGFSYHADNLRTMMYTFDQAEWWRHASFMKSVFQRTSCHYCVRRTPWLQDLLLLTTRQAPWGLIISKP